MKTIVIAAPDMLPPEMADDPNVLVLDPASLDEELLGMLDAASGGMMDEGMDGGEGALADWAAEEEKEPEHAKGYGDEDADEDKMPFGRGKMYGMGDDEDEDEDKMPFGRGKDDDDDMAYGRGKDDDDDMPFGRGEDDDEEMSREGSGEGDEDEDEIAKLKKEAGAGRGRFGGKGKSGRGVPALSAWARSMGGFGSR